MYECNNDFFSTTTATTATVDFYSNSYDASHFADSSPPLYDISDPHHQRPPHLMLPTNEFDSAFPVFKSEICYSSSSSYGSPSSLPNCYVQQRPSLAQRSLSSHSLQRDSFYHPIFSPLDESHPEIFDSDAASIRKVFSTGDLQGINVGQHSRQSESPLSQEACVIEAMNKVGRYSAEERKERIERYRSKRNQRNFNKKIKYACRKTLADSRPRIRGRFARNDEMGESSQTQWNQMGTEENEEDEQLWLNFFDPFSSTHFP